MDPWSAMSVATPLIGGAASYFGQKKANKANVGMAREQMQFQERMSNTQHQRAMADMREAGLNPILSGKFGGAGAPSGASAQQVNELAPAVSSAVDVRRAKAELANLEQQNSNLRADEAIKVATAKALALGLPGLQRKAEVDDHPAGKVFAIWDRINPFANFLKGF